MKSCRILAIISLLFIASQWAYAEEDDFNALQTAMDHHDLRNLFEYAQTGTKAVRLKAIEDLIILNDPQAVPHLVQLLGDPDNDIAMVALWGIPNFGSYAATDDVLGRLMDLNQHHPSIDIRHAAEVIQEDLRDPEKLKLMQDSLTSKDRDMRQEALAFFIKRKDLSILLQGRNMLRDTDPFHKEIGLILIHGLDDKDSTELIETLLQDPSPEVRSAAALVIADWKEEGALSDLQPLLQDPTSMVREHTIAALGAHPTPITMAVLAHTIGDKVVTVRVAAAKALSQFASPESLDALWRLAMDDNNNVREWAIKGLVNAKSPAVTTQMKTYLKDRNSRRHRRAAVAYLSNPAASGNGDWLTPALHDPDPAIRLAAVHGVLALPNEKVKIRLIYMLLEPQKEIRMAILERIQELLKLPGLNGKVLNHNLTVLMNDSDIEIRSTAEKALVMARLN